MSKYKVGDKVLVKSHEENLTTGLYLGGMMKDCCGKICTISDSSHDAYRLEEDKFGFYWSEDNFKDCPTVKTTYKPGDVVTVRSDLSEYRMYYMNDGSNPMGMTDQMLTKRGKKVKIKSMTKTGKYLIEGSIFPWVDEMFVDETKRDLSKYKGFKAGDRVRVREDLNRDDLYYMANGGYSDSVIFEMLNLAGKVVTIADVGYCYTIKECGYNWTDEMFEPGVVEEKPRKAWKLVITGEGDKTTAEYSVGYGKTKTAVVNRYCEDQYSVRKAVETVTNKVLPKERWLVGVKFETGSKVYDYYTTDCTIVPGDKVIVPVGKDNHHVPATVVTIASNFVADAKYTIKYVDRKCTEEESPVQYLSKDGVFAVTETFGDEGSVALAISGKVTKEQVLKTLDRLTK